MTQRIVLAIGDQYVISGSTTNQRSKAVITSINPFTYYWEPTGASGCWSHDVFMDQIRLGYLSKVIPDTTPVNPAPAPIKTSVEILKACVEVQAERGKSRDSADGERSMKRTVDMFNACFGTNLTETQGWQFMVCLKMARSVHGEFNMDDFIDGTSYFALAGESAAKEA